MRNKITKERLYLLLPIVIWLLCIEMSELYFDGCIEKPISIYTDKIYDLSILLIEIVFCVVSWQLNSIMLERKCKNVVNENNNKIQIKVGIICMLFSILSYLLLNYIIFNLDTESELKFAYFFLSSIFYTICYTASNTFITRRAVISNLIK